MRYNQTSQHSEISGKRNNAVTRFISIFMAAAIGLGLTVASSVWATDSAWGPSSKPQTGGAPSGLNEGASPAPQPNINVDALAQQIMSDPGSMALLEKLKNDPAMQKILNDPELMKAVREKDLGRLARDPNIQALENNSSLQDLLKRNQ